MLTAFPSLLHVVSLLRKCVYGTFAYQRPPLLVPLFRLLSVISQYERKSFDFDPPLLSSEQSSWLQIQRYGFHSRRYQIFWEVVGLEQGPLSLVSTIEELLGGKSSCSGLENREYVCRDSLRWPRDTLYPQKLALTSPTKSGRSVGIVRSRTKATEFSFSFSHLTSWWITLSTPVITTFLR
jgi:hypothetical protein